MKITIVTLFPAMIESFFNESIIKRAQSKGAVEINVVNLRDYATDKYQTVDESPYGGGAGMVLRVDVLAAALNSIGPGHTILTSAKGAPHNQRKAQELTSHDHIVIIAGHYESVDERIMPRVDEEISLGDFVMTGGEITACAIVDSVVRLLPGVLKKEEATAEESFYEVAVAELIRVVGPHDTLKVLQSRGVEKVQLLEYPHYTRPEIYEDARVPDILLSGDHAKIRDWRLRKSYEETLQKRPDLLS